MTITLTPKQLTDLFDEEEVEGFEGWFASADVNTGDFDGEKGSMNDYKITLESPEGLIYTAYDGYFNNIAGHCFYDNIEFSLEKQKAEKVKLKTAKITIESIKNHGWYEVGIELGFSEDKIYKTFEYGEFGDIEIEIDENLNIVGGRVIPSGK